MPWLESNPARSRDDAAPAARSFLDLAAERGEADGLRQMQVEAGVPGGGLVLVAAVTGQRDEPDAAKLRHAPSPPRELVCRLLLEKKKAKAPARSALQI